MLDIEGLQHLQLTADQERIIRQAHTRVDWGYKLGDLARFLKPAQLDPDAEHDVMQSLRKAQAEIRAQVGWSRIYKGIALCAASAAVYFVMARPLQNAVKSDVMRNDPLIYSTVLGVLGLACLIGGLYYLFEKND